MALTKSFKDLVQRRLANDPAFGDALLCEGIDTMQAGDHDASPTERYDVAEPLQDERGPSVP